MIFYATQTGKKTMTQNLPATLSDRLNALKQRATQSETVTNWQPSAGETIAGIISGSGTFTHSLYGQQKTMLLSDDSGQITSVILTPYLMNGLKQQGAVLGDLCAITFHGKAQSKAGHNFNKYTLLVDKVN